MKCDLSDDFSVAMVGVPSVMLGLILGWTTANVPPVPLPESRTIVFDCINIQHAPNAQDYPSDHAARYALIRLQRSCKMQENAIALMQIWESNPTVDEVLEPETKENP